MRCLIFCAGEGKRLRPITNRIPKPMVRIGGKPVLERLVDHLNNYGITEIIVNLHYKPQAIYKYFGTRLLYFYEPKLLGEEETEKQLHSWLGTDYIIANGDTLTDLNINELTSYYGAMSWDKVYTGIAYKYGSCPTRMVDFKCWWQDVGTPEGLKKARLYYA